MKLSVTLFLLALIAPAQPQRPKILGLAHIALFTADVEKSRRFYKDFLGYGEPFDLKNPDGSLSLTFIKINDRQYVELFPERESRTDRLHHISVYTDNAEAMRLYLASRGIKVPDRVPKGRIGNANFNITDPDGHTVEIVQYEPDGWSMREKGKHMGPERISTRMLHLGILVGDLAAAKKFYGDVLGFLEIWRGSSDGTKTCRNRTTGARRTTSAWKCRIWTKPWRCSKPSRRGKPTSATWRFAPAVIAGGNVICSIPTAHARN